MHRSPLRVARAVLIVSGLGATVGFLLGTVLVAVIYFFGPALGAREIALMSLFFGGGFGSLTGAVLAPILGFVLLRDVPLGRSILWTAAGTAIGTLAGAALGGLVLLGVVGFVGAGVALRIRTNLAKKTARIAPNAESLTGE